MKSIVSVRDVHGVPFLSQTGTQVVGNTPNRGEAERFLGEQSTTVTQKSRDVRSRRGRRLS